jgi:hypothetical protein
MKTSRKVKALRDAADGRYARNGTPAGRQGADGYDFETETDDPWQAEGEFLASRGLDPDEYYSPQVRMHIDRSREHARGSTTVTMKKIPWWSRLDSWLLIIITVANIAFAAAAGGASWHQQYVYIFQWKHDHFWAAIQAFLPDIGAILCATAAVVCARLKRRAGLERLGVVLFALSSGLMNFFGADVKNLGSIATYIGPPLAFAFSAEIMFRSVRYYALRNVEVDETEKVSAWWVGLKIFLYLARIPLAPVSTLRGMRWWVLITTPLPSKPGTLTGVAPPVQLVSAEAAAIESGPRPPAAPAKRGRPRATTGPTADLIRLIGDEHGWDGLDPGQASQLGADYAPKVGLTVKAARKAARGHVQRLQEGSEV